MGQNHNSREGRIHSANVWFFENYLMNNNNDILKKDQKIIANGNKEHREGNQSRWVRLETKKRLRNQTKIAWSENFWKKN